MNSKIKIRVLVPAVLCIVLALVVFGGGRAEELDEQTSLKRAQLLEVVSETHEDRGQRLEKVASDLRKGVGPYVSKRLMPEYVSFLKDKNAQVQLLGASGLYAIESPQSRKALIKFLASKGEYFRKLQEKERAGDQTGLESKQLVWEMWASMVAIEALGKVGDESCIPLLESLMGIKFLQYEGARLVADALVALGSVESFSKVPPDAEKEKIWEASSGIRKIRDPNKAPELMAVVRDPRVAGGIRSSAIDALAEINPPGIANLYVDVIGDPNYSKAMRSTTAMAAGRIKDDFAEKHVLVYANDPNSDIRAYAFMGLVFGKPEVYLDRWFEKMMDTNEDPEFRKRIAGIQFYMPWSVLRTRRTQLYECLNAGDKNGRPIDKIRIDMWRTINKLYHEEPSVTLTTRDSNVTGSIRHILNLRIMRQDHRLRYAERQNKIEEEVQRIVAVYGAD